LSKNKNLGHKGLEYRQVGSYQGIGGPWSRVFGAPASSQQDVLPRGSQASRVNLAGLWHCKLTAAASGTVAPGRRRGAGCRGPRECPSASECLEAGRRGASPLNPCPSQLCRLGILFSGSTNYSITLPPDCAQFKGISHGLDAYQ